MEKEDFKNKIKETITNFEECKSRKVEEGLYELLNHIDNVIEETKKETVQEMIELSDQIEVQEPDGGTRQWMAFKKFRNTMRDIIK